MAGYSKVQHRVPVESLTRLKPHKLGRHYHKVPQYIKEVSSKYPRIISDYFVRNYRINLELRSSLVHEMADLEAECIYISPVGKVGFRIERPLLAEALECYYGGNGVPSQEAPTSNSEQRMRIRLGQDIAEIFTRTLLAGECVGGLKKHENEFDQAVWEYVTEFQFSTISGETRSVFLYLDSQLADVLTARFSRPNTEFQTVDPKQHVLHLPVQLQCIVAAIQMPLAQVLSLRPDDIIPIRLHDRSEVRINQQKLFRGTVYAEDGALFLTSLESA